MCIYDVSVIGPGDTVAEASEKDTSQSAPQKVSGSGGSVTCERVPGCSSQEGRQH